MKFVHILNGFVIVQISLVSSTVPQYCAELKGPEVGSEQVFICIRGMERFKAEIRVQEIKVQCLRCLPVSILMISRRLMFPYLQEIYMLIC